ncbi:iron chelate uptake ABC transporter family permease subunit [Micromonospora sp. WMMD1076]|uniref:FecCD family ABC transporter permease n=1 Tax=Micromonospora sp. WMMD1076 TaxID=3016103 RepID=UPI00249B08B5|nr:iron chelate uptake ABC transporter family permease subunit [Micromonospora sp. WMMD1076]WFF08041.1 iron chelate uptake ABC transporter family permease subunit [Micromonospora sp. WMMD1076]
MRRRTDARARRVTVVLAAAVLALVALTLSYGSFQISLPDVVRALLGRPTPPQVDYIVHTLRLPRALVGALAGLAFGLAGAIFQQLVRNPLASPDVIGVSSGASAAAVLSIVLFPAAGDMVPAVALAGALGTSLLIYLLAWRSGVSGYRFVLVGIGIGAATAGLTAFLLTRADVRTAQEALIWLAGSLNGRTWGNVAPLAVAVLLLVPAALLLGRTLSGLQLGDDLARGLGLPVERGRLVLLLLGVGLVGVATAAAGPISYIAFMSGPIAGRLVGGGRPVLLPAGLVGAVLVLAADFIGAHLIGENQFPVGVVTGIIGAPYLLWLLTRANRTGRGG